MHYTQGNNWMNDMFRRNSVSHLGMHCTAKELTQWREFFASRDIPVAQEVMTQSHTNPVISGKRNYNYVIFDTKEILGVGLKFIVRIDVLPQGERHEDHHLRHRNDRIAAPQRGTA